MRNGVEMLRDASYKMWWKQESREADRQLSERDLREIVDLIMVFFHNSDKSVFCSCEHIEDLKIYQEIT